MAATPIRTAVRFPNTRLGTLSKTGRP